VTLTTSQDPTLSQAVVVFEATGIDARKLYNALYDNEKIGTAGRANGLRISPHFYNLHSEIDRTVGNKALHDDWCVGNRFPLKPNGCRV